MSEYTDLILAARQTLAANDQQKMLELSFRLAAINDDEALDTLLDIFTSDRHSDKRSASALVEATHPQTSARLADRMLEWISRKDHRLGPALSKGCEVLVRRGDASVLPVLAEGTRLAGDDTILTRNLLIARVALGDQASSDELRDRFVVPRYSGEDRIAEYFIAWAGPAATFDLLAPIVRAFHDGDETMRNAAPKVLFSLTNPTTRSEGTTRIELPLPPRDPRWFELGLELLLARTRPAIASAAEKLLDVEHPARLSLLKAAHERLKGSRALAERVHADEPHPILSHLDDELVARCDLRAAITREDDGWTLSMRDLKRADVEATLQKLGERAQLITGLSFGGRQLNEEAMQILAEWPSMGHFTRVNLAFTPITPKGMSELLRSPHLGRLEVLDLSGCGLNKAALRALGKAKTLPTLNALYLARGERDKPGAAEVQALIDGPLFSRLTRLRLKGWDLTGDAVPTTICQALGGSQVGKNLRWLDLSNQAGLLGDRLSSLLHCLAENGGQLDTLILASCYRPAQGGEDWTTWQAPDGLQPATPLLSLRRLVLDECGVDSDFLAALVRAGFFKDLTSLSMRRNALDSRQLTPLVEYQGPCSLEVLDLSDCAKLDRPALEALAGWPHAAKLRRLGLHGRTDLRNEDLDHIPDGIRQAVLAAGWPDGRMVEVRTDR
jgi:hypothetical protein